MKDLLSNSLSTSVSHGFELANNDICIFNLIIKMGTKFFKNYK